MTKPKKFVYFMRPVGMVGPIKIGFSNIPMDRLEAFSTWSPFPLEIITTTPGGQKEERFLHCCFAFCHLHHEWFASTPLLLETVEAISTGTTIAELRMRLSETGKIRHRRRNRETGLFWEPLFIIAESEAA